MLSVERLILLFFPFKRYFVLKRTKKLMIIAALVTVSLILYSYVFFTTELKHNEDNQQMCVPKETWIFLVQSMSIVDSVLTFIVPFVIVLFVNMAILIKMRTFKRTPSIPKIIYSKNWSTEFNRNSSQNETSFQSPVGTVKVKRIKQANSTSTMTTVTIPKAASSIEISSGRDRLRRGLKMSASNSVRLSKEKLFFDYSNTVELLRRRKLYRKMATILLIISISFLCLNFLSFWSKFTYFMRGFNYQAQDLASQANQVIQHSNGTNLGQDDVAAENEFFRWHLDASELDEVLERVSCYLYYLNFSINFFLYTLSGSKFGLKKKLIKYAQCTCSTRDTAFYIRNYS